MSLGSLPLGRLIDPARHRARRPGTGRLAPLETPHYIELPVTDLMAWSAIAVAEATRGGQTRVLATLRAWAQRRQRVRADARGVGTGSR